MISIEDSIFISRCRTAISMMRENGVNEVRIACIITEIRSAALSQEYARIQAMVTANPPRHLPHGEVMEMVKEYEA